MEENRFDVMMARYDELVQAQRAIDEEIAGIRKELEDELKRTGESRMLAGQYRINLVASRSAWFDSGALKKDNPELAQQYVRTKEFVTLKIQKVAK